MRKTAISVWYFCVIGTTVFGAISEDKIAKFTAAAWKPVPESMDISYTVTTQDFSRSEEQFRSTYKKLFSELYQNVTPERLNQSVELNVQSRMKEQREGKKTKIRIRYDSKQLRIDMLHEPFPKTIIQKEGESGGNYRREYYHSTKELFKKPIESREESSELSKVSGFVTIPDSMATAIQRSVGDRQKDRKWDPNEAKIERLRSGSTDVLSLAIEDNPESPKTKDNVENILFGRKKKPILKTLVTVDKNDYSIVYDYREILMSTGNLMKTETRSDFDSYGFPHKVVLNEYDNEGKVKLHQVYEIENVHINPSFSDDVFNMESKDYKIVDIPK
jgi:hypothetical protein